MLQKHLKVSNLVDNRSKSESKSSRMVVTNGQRRQSGGVTMDRPYIICHMVTSLDGKVTGEFLKKSEYSKFIEDYYRIHREYGADGFLCGRVTMEGSFPQLTVPYNDYDGPPIAREDYIAEKARSTQLQ